MAVPVVEPEPLTSNERVIVVEPLVKTAEPVNVTLSVQFTGTLLYATVTVTILPLCEYDQVYEQGGDADTSGLAATAMSGGTDHAAPFARFRREISMVYFSPSAGMRISLAATGRLSEAAPSRPNPFQLTRRLVATGASGLIVL